MIAFGIGTFRCGTIGKYKNMVVIEQPVCIVALVEVTN